MAIPLSKNPQDSLKMHFNAILGGNLISDDTIHSFLIIIS